MGLPQRNVSSKMVHFDENNIMDYTCTFHDFVLRRTCSQDGDAHYLQVHCLDRTIGIHRTCLALSHDLTKVEIFWHTCVNILNSEIVITFTQLEIAH